MVTARITLTVMTRIGHENGIGQGQVQTYGHSKCNGHYHGNGHAHGNGH
jgi:hypothetical protein